MTLDWNSIRPLNGGRDKGFEELCAQLARAECPAGSTFIRKGRPDAGVECYAILSDTSEWGWQSKYVHGLGGSQWSQIDQSIATALEKHPRLVRYFVCVPVDLPDARVDGQTSARERWEEHVAKWSGWATERGMVIDFIYWGAHELIERLTRAEHTGRVRFWFDIRGFDAAWFDARLEESLRTAGPRYTPQIHVDLPIASALEAFGRTDRFFDREKARAREIRQKLRRVQYSEGASEPAIEAAVAELSSSVNEVLTALGAVEMDPTGPLPFKAISEHIRSSEEAAETLIPQLHDREREFEADRERTNVGMSGLSYQSNPFRDRRIQLVSLASTLRSARESVDVADRLAGTALLLLRGAAGTGKTHLLCDVARQRISEGSPTVLLMGQRFVSNDAPWRQALEQLDLATLSAEEFVGALESAAQAAGSRALVMIDAVNEGAGRTIWPSHLAAFLAHLKRSPWIGVVLAVRSSYEEIVVPEDVRTGAAGVTHHGFMEHEYDATKTFFVYYGLELPSTPLLAPEFRNPLFLKTMCEGLKESGERRLPRGFQGITAVFDLYLTGVNGHLASSLDFHPRNQLVRRALDEFVGATVSSGESWLTLAKAGEIINALLPGRDFGRSLYRGLVAEGILVEDAVQRDGGNFEEIVFIGYERLADHLTAKILLDRHLDVDEPTAAFAQGAPLAFICEETTYVSPGLLEAMCIQLPERVGQELITIAPTCVNRWGLGDAFRQSLVWRAHGAFTDSTWDALAELDRSESDLSRTLDVLLTVATLPEHPLNGRFLDQLLREDEMPERDAWWSVYLHHAWDTHGAVDRLVDWASSVDPDASIDEETVDLCATTLSWLLTSSNRFLRDRATLALVNLLTGRLAAVVRLVELFASVDDPYVAERVYAVAYGVAMRCHDPAAIGALATCVYGRVFASGSPPPHIFLRDYARGVVERALYLGSHIDVDPDRIRPPYDSTWPAIPSEEEIERLLPDRSSGSRSRERSELARDRIASSVMHGDFARYVIGTNWSASSSWLSLKLEEQEESEYGARQPPRFDVRQIQRYIVWRVFDLGWTSERFGQFDGRSMEYNGRQASKAERIGKKYQWIAYHEIMAFVSDHFQYCDHFWEGDDQAYEGPWQQHLRDIDPSCTIRSVRGGTSWDGHSIGWWGSARYDMWGDPRRPQDWIRRSDDLPRVEELLIATDPDDDSRWVNGQAYFSWKQQPPADRERSDVERRELWYVCTGYLLRADEVDSFLKWAGEVELWDRRMPEPAEVHRMFLGEHAWSPASRYFEHPYYGDNGWVQPGANCPVRIRSVARKYLRETGGLDCSIADSFILRLPVSDLVAGLGIKWSGRGADFTDAKGRLVVQDPTVDAEGPSALLIRMDRLREFLARDKLTVCWVVLGEKRVLPPESLTGPRHPVLRISGAYVLSDGYAIGTAKHTIIDPNNAGGEGRA